MLQSNEYFSGKVKSIGFTSSSTGRASVGVMAEGEYTFGTAGSLLLAMVITLACLTTAVGLLTACGEYFSELLPVSYRKVVLAFGLFSLLVANQGLSQLISVSVPVLVGLYPLAIVLVGLSLLSCFWCSAPRVFIPVMLITLLFGLADAFNAAGFKGLVPQFLSHLPLAAQGLGWVVPVGVTLLLAALFDRLCGEALPKTCSVYLKIVIVTHL